MNDLQCFIFASIIRADNDDYDEATKQNIMRRYDKFKDSRDYNWEYILEPIKETEHYEAYLDILK